MTMGEVSVLLVTSKGADSLTCGFKRNFENWRKLGNHQGRLAQFQKQRVAHVLHFSTDAGSGLPRQLK